jgi:hypothetical protein
MPKQVRHDTRHPELVSGSKRLAKKSKWIKKYKKETNYFVFVVYTSEDKTKRLLNKVIDTHPA